MDALWYDIRSGLRSLRKARGFTGLALLVFALGIGVNTTLFSVVSALFLRPLAVKAPEELVYVYMVQRSTREWIEPDVVRALRLHDETFAGFTLHGSISKYLTTTGATELRPGEAVQANYFELLGVSPMLGRTFLPGEDAQTDAQGSIVISHGLWTRTFQSDANILGRQVELCCFYPERSATPIRRAFQIVGVMPPEFRGISDPWTPSEYWIATALEGGALIARRHSHVTLRQAQETVKIQGEHLVAALKKDARGAFLDALNQRRYEALAAIDVRTPYDPNAVLVPARLATALMAIVAVVLVIAAANIAGLLMARGATRAGETAVRRVLGASTWRVMRQHLIEGLLLSVLGGVLGLPIAQWLLGLLRATTPARFFIDATIDRRVLLFTLAAGVAVGVLTGLAPALQTARVNLLSALAGVGHSATGRTRAGVRHGILIPQVALSLVLLVAAGLQLKTLLSLELADVGYTSDNVVVVKAGLLADPGEKAGDGTLAERRAQRSQAFYRQLRARLEQIPGASAVAVSGTLPVRALASTEYDPSHDAITKEASLAGLHGNVGTLQAIVGPGYFRTMGIRILQGRDFDERDDEAREAVVIVSRNLAERLWPGANPLGRSMALENRFPAADEKLRWLEVIGVVNDIDPVLRDKSDAPMAYLAMGQAWQPSPSAVVARVPREKQQAIAAMRRAVMGADSFATVYGTQTLDQMVAEILYPRRVAAAVLVVAGLVGILLASVGLYGVISYSVVQRVREIGVRTALGAERADILKLVIGEGVRVAGVGYLFGGVLAYWAWRVSVTRVAAVPPLDATTLLGAGVALAVVILLACYVPARRAARIDPLASLRAL